MVLLFLVPSITIAFLSFAKLASAASAAEWATRSIYQVMTDRFALTNGSNTPCDLLRYCGGTWAGIRNKLDYIEGMGFTAIQISPIVKNFPEHTIYGDAFHGYWPQEWYALNENFGDEEDLKELVEELHKRDMLLMVDVVINDMAVAIKEDMTNETVIDYVKLIPFNDKKYYHPWCNLTDYFDIPMAQKCWLGSSVVALPDLDTENPVVESMINTWIQQLISNYSIDGLRIDAAKHVNDEFLHSFVQVAGVFTFGEVYNVDVKDVCRYQEFVDGVPNFPTYFSLIEAFANGNMLGLGAMVETVLGECKNVSYMGTFAENHDLPRFASINPDLNLAMNAVTFTMLADGIPTMYQNQEQHVSGNYSPFNRNALWTTGYNTSSPIYNLTATLNTLRNHAILTDPLYISTLATTLNLTNSTYVTRKGSEGSQVVTVYSNAGNIGGSLNFSGGYKANTTIVEVLSCENYRLDEKGQLSVNMDGGAPRVFYPSEKLDGSGLCGRSLRVKVKDEGNVTDSKAGNTTEGGEKKSAGLQIQAWMSTVILCVLWMSAFSLL